MAQTHFRGGYPLSGDPQTERQSHVGKDRPRCRVCDARIFGDEDWLPNKCLDAEDGRHVYPDGSRAPLSPAQRAAQSADEAP